MRRMLLLLPIVAACLQGCQSARTNPPGEAAPADSAATPRAARPVAYVEGQAVDAAQLQEALYEAAGGEALADLVLGQEIARELEQRGLVVDAAAINRERELIAGTLSADPDTAARLLGELRASRGLGKHRFEAMLRRNAGLRLLVADQVEVTEAAVKQAYLIQHGPRYRVRLLVVADAGEAGRLRARAAAGEAFADLASLHSADPSAAQGGLLSPISPADPRYPQALRTALPKLAPGQPSPVLALDDRFAVLWLEDKIESDGTALADVRDALTGSVRLRAQRLRMEQLARQMLARSNVIVLDPTLKRAWESQRQRLIEP